MSAYRLPPQESRGPARRGLDPWLLALFFAIVTDAWQIGMGCLDGRSIAGELGFAAILGTTAAVVLVLRWKGARSRAARREIAH